MVVTAERDSSPRLQEAELETCLRQQVTFLLKNQLPNGLWTASVVTESLGPRPEYLQYVWPRDCVHIIRALLLVGEVEAAGRGLEGLLTIMESQRAKLDEVIANPTLAHEEIGHYNRFMPRYRRKDLFPVTRENGDDWNNFQNDVPGAILWLFGKVQEQDLGFLKNNQGLFEKLVSYLEAIKFWEDQDSGFWEEDREVRASSIAAVTAGLKAVKPFIHVPSQLLSQGEEALARLLPQQETPTRENDGALLYAIDPFGVVDGQKALIILERVEEQLLRENGCLRYPGDSYNRSEQGKEAEWVHLLFKLAIGHHLVGEEEKARSLLNKGLSLRWEGLFPEAFNGGSPVNYPLPWASAEAINAIVMIFSPKGSNPWSSTLVPIL